MSIPQNSAWKTRLVSVSFPDRSFDIVFGRACRENEHLCCSWKMVELAEEISHGESHTTEELLQLLNEFEWSIDRRLVSQS